jgi:ubiquinone/menaquinone biosynthesis C-methylase UbiE
MPGHVCPWWGGYFLDNRLRRLIHPPERILGTYLRPSMAAMDFGCGMGMFSVGMARLVGETGRVLAVDLQPQMLSVVRKRAGRAGLSQRIQTHQCSRDSLDLDDVFDFVLAFWSAHEVPDLERWWQQVGALLAPSGRLLLLEPIGHVTASAFADSLELAKRSGLQVEQQPKVRLSHAALLAK